MRKVITSGRIPIKLWLDDIEEGALIQAKNLANLPFAFRHIALMPDAHQGFGMPIGGVLATSEVVIPNAVGVDIGCGMCAIKTNLLHADESQLKQIMRDIRSRIPVGSNRHKIMQSNDLMPALELVSNGIVEQQYSEARKQLGTLGGGNHFIEIQRDTDGYIWVMVHSGSRNLGKTIADHYNKLAIDLNARWHSPVPKQHELAFFPIQSKEANAYLSEMQFCVDFAFANRKLMMQFIQECVADAFKHVRFEPMINIAHNYASWERHFNSDVLIHRKGATSARVGEVGIIPGSQGTKSYIVEGLGNAESFSSCSHGAGRVMGRRQAMLHLSLEEEAEKLNRQGIIHAVRSKRDLDEAPGAYKDIDTVMRNQQDLVKVLVELQPLAVIKG